jgi:molecular chaperone IbpA
MKSVNFAPLFRSSVGFDNMMDLFDSVSRSDAANPSYPPYDIAKLGDDQYRISIAVAGFTPEDIEIESTQNALTVSGQKERGPSDGEYLHRGIAARAFKRTFRLAEHVRVESARLEHGLLHVDLVREVPEAMKPRRIAISSESPQSVIDAAA